MGIIAESLSAVGAFVGLRTTPPWLKALISAPVIAVALFFGVALWLQPHVLKQFAPFLVDLRLPLKGLATLALIALLALVLAVLWMQSPETAVAEIIDHCIRRALLTRTQAQMSRAAMFASIADCRQKVQLSFKGIRNNKLRQQAMDLMSNLDSICRLEPYDATPTVDARIDRYKGAALDTLRAMAAAVGTSYPLPQSGHLAESAYWDLDKATLPPTDEELKNSHPIS